MARVRTGAVVVVVALAAVGLVVGMAVAERSATGSRSATTSLSSRATDYSHYLQMMRNYETGQTSANSNGSMMGSSWYRQMMGTAVASRWMHGGSMPGSMMGDAADPGRVMGALLSNAPGPRVSAAEGRKLASVIPPGATVDAAHRQIAFSGLEVRLSVVASPTGGPDETFRIAGMVNPTINIVVGSRVSIDFVNADPDTAHGFVVTSSASTASWMPMMTASSAFPGSALWFLGHPTAAGLHEGAVRFDARFAGTYRYVCPIPGHAQSGMVGTFVVSG